MRESFVMYTANIDQILLLNMEQRGNLFTAIMLYAADKELPQMDGMTQMAFSFIKAQLDRDNQKYQKMIESRREAGKLGGRPKVQNQKKQMFFWKIKPKQKNMIM